MLDLLLPYGEKSSFTKKETILGEKEKEGGEVLHTCKLVLLIDIRV